ncbi:hypothetical protein CEUSTIGMA_g6214.t1 [Chlamydomonas eustigma]|uniref:Uncharacterized protein n=1 Tax=Chlamydomonas eustigma TaxID=1157962 RepID=A0A250X6T2_9CHLO|nr:hypothetical protein CEUSTIGMA_g6214.t1 [Chlamydomonas eustigma]|eukprot:GAX78777.1 hypothetical protein CEUSTIGMA_g6214.t1 [Chlamydomonas eustigma]
MADTSTVQGLLLQEAQQEIASLRNDLYNTRRIAEDRRVSITAISTDNAQLKDKLSVSESTVLQLQQQLTVFEAIEKQLVSAKEDIHNLQQELQMSVQARRVLQEELGHERKHLADLGQAKAMLESERSVLQRAKDDLAAQLRVASHRAQEAEQEQVNAEEEAASLRSELARLQHSELGMGMSSAHASTSHMEDMQQVGALRHSDQSASLQQALENERSRAASLLDSMNTLRLETQSLKQQLAVAKQQLADGPCNPSPQVLVEEAVALRFKLQASDARVCQLEEELRLSIAAASQQQQQQQLGATTEASAESNYHLGRPTLTDGGSQSSHLPEATLQHGTAPHVPYQHQQQGGRPPRHHRVSSGGGSESAAVDGSTGLVDESALVAELQKRQAQVLQLKQSRDKLLEEIDSQWEEMDRLAAENRAVAEELSVQRRLAVNWEAQAQDALSNVERLKGLLEESASWEVGELASAAGSTAPRTGSAVQAAAVGSDPAAAAALRLRALHTALLEEKAKSADLELGMRALAAELVRAQHASVSIGRSVLPALSGIEHRLGGMCRKAQCQVEEAISLT